MPNVQLYDTTLRDGTQAEGISFSVDEKLKIARRLDEFGFDFIEGGYPASNPKDMEFFRRARDLKLDRARIAAFGMTRRKGTPAHEDVTLQAILATGAQVATIVGKSWTLHVTDALRTTLEENLRMIEESVAYLRSQGLYVIYDAEHFFDGCRANPEYALSTLEAAARGGASVLTLCDTNGGRLPREIAEMTELVVRRHPDLRIGVHTHNDSGLGVANSIAAIEAGATLVQGTINGYGERCGNADLIQVIPILQLKMGYDLVSKQTLSRLSELSRFIDDCANVRPDDRRPFVGRSAFAHKGGMHVSALLRRPETYEHIDPEVVGNRRRVLVSELAGASNLIFKAQEYGIKLERGAPVVGELVDKLKEMERDGYVFEGAEASFELLLRKAVGEYEPYFTPVGFEILSNKATRSDHAPSVAAKVEVEVGGERLSATGVGNGPVNALDNALRNALGDVYPEVSRIQLSDYKVRTLSEGEGTGARVRVLIQCTADGRSWTTVGASTDVVKASWEALADAVEYGLTACEAKPAQRLGLTRSR